MDLGIKTLAQLSAEAKEKRYVTIEVGSKISGYTKEYLDRLCRLRKVEFLMGANEQFVIELDSLLGETHTILLSFDDITFVDKKDITGLTDMQKLSVGSEGVVGEGDVRNVRQQSPAFAEKRASPTRAPGTSPFSYVGRAVVSGSIQKVDAKENETNIPMTLGAVPPLVSEDGVTLAPTTEVTSSNPSSATPRVTPSVTVVPNVILPDAVSPIATIIKPVQKNIPAMPPLISATKEEDVIHNSTVPSPAITTEQHSQEILQSKTLTSEVKKEVTNVEKIPFVAPPPQSPTSRKHFVSEIPLYAIPHKPPKNFSEQSQVEKPNLLDKDEWDAMLFGNNTQEQEAIIQISPPVSVQTHTVSVPQISSPYHPIKTSLDATEHHETLPLFPTVGSAVAPARITRTAGSSVSEAHPSIPDLGPDRRVKIFSPEKYGRKQKNDIAAVATSAIPMIAPTVAVVALTEKIPTASMVVALPIQEVSKNIVKKSYAIPSIRVMPQVPMGIPAILPAVEGEHHLVLREKNPLLKSSGLNLAFAIFFFSAGAMLLGGVMRDSSFVNNSILYVAGVGAAIPLENIQVPIVEDKSPEVQQANTVLPFSDEIVVAEGANEDTLLIQPIFRDTAGSPHEYTASSGGTDIATSTIP